MNDCQWQPFPNDKVQTSDSKIYDIDFLVFKSYLYDIYEYFLKFQTFLKTSTTW